MAYNTSRGILGGTVDLGNLGSEDAMDHSGALSGADSFNKESPASVIDNDLFGEAASSQVREMGSVCAAH